MILPIYILVLLGTIIFLAAFYIGYSLIYKRKNSTASSRTSEQQKLMPAPLHVAAVLIIVFLFIALLFSLFLHYGISHPITKDGEIDVDAFYAEVKEVGEDTVTVAGIPLNDKAYRGEFTFQTYEGLPVEWHDRQISISDLDEGNLVSVVLLTDLGGTEDIFKIRLLDD